jgi:hypothetical protein
MVYGQAAVGGPPVEKHCYRGWHTMDTGFINTMKANFIQIIFKNSSLS